jgi:hypothetical protein
MFALSNKKKSLNCLSMVDQINVPQDAKNGKNLKLRKTNYNIAK